MTMLTKVLMMMAVMTAAVKVREPAPEWSGTAVMPDGEFQELSSEDFLGKWLVLFFYPLDYTFVCPTEIRAYSEAYEAEFQNLNTAVVGISVDSKFTHLAWTKTDRADGGVGKLAIPLVADITKDIALSFDVLADPNDDLAGVALRGTFIIDPDGIVRAFTVHDEPLGRDIQESVRAVKGLQYADEHQGEGCPASWQPGTDTILANPDDSKTFFKKWGA